MHELLEKFVSRCSCRGCLVQKQKGAGIRWKNKVQWSQIISLATFIDLWGHGHIVSALNESFYVKTNLARVVLQPTLFSLGGIPLLGHISQDCQCKRYALKFRPLTLFCNVAVPGSLAFLKDFRFKGAKGTQRCSVESKPKIFPPV